MNIISIAYTTLNCLGNSSPCVFILSLLRLLFLDCFVIVFVVLCLAPLCCDVFHCDDISFSFSFTPVSGYGYKTESVACRWRDSLLHASVGKQRCYFLFFFFTSYWFCHFLCHCQEKSETASKEAEAAKTAWMCRVCLANEVDTVVTPCGHVLCQRCSAAVSRCPFCRRPVTKSQRMYRP